MIMCTKNFDVPLKRVVGAENIMIQTPNAIIDLLNVDPTISKPEKEGFVITSDDIKIARVKQAFLSAAAAKHPAVKIIFVNKGRQPVITEAPGVDVVLNRPKQTVRKHLLQNAREKE